MSSKSSLIYGSDVLPSFPSFFPPVSEREPAPPWLQLGIPALLISTFLVPHRYRLAFVPVLAWYLTLIPKYHAGGPMDTFVVLMNAVTAYARWIDTVLPGCAEKRFWRRTDEDKAREGGKMLNGRSPTEIEEEKKKGLNWILWKITWAASLLYGVRGVGWNWQVKNVPRGVPEGYPRRSFVIHQLWRATYLFIFFDLISIYMRRTLSKLVPEPSAVAALSLPAHLQVLYAWLTIFQAVNVLKCVYALGAVLTVSLHLATPSSWPPLMDEWFPHAYTVRNVWGKVYHQMLRRTTQAPSVWLCRKLGFRKGGLRSRYFQLYMAFAISSLLHYLGALNAGAPGMLQPQNFMFLIQAVGITFEDAVIALGRWAGIRESAWTRNVGRIWTVAWFSWSVRYGFAASIAGSVHLPVTFVTLLEPYIGEYMG